MAPSYNDEGYDNKRVEKRRYREGDEEEGFKIHISRVPTKFTEEIVLRILADKFGSDVVSKVELILPREEEDEEGGFDDNNNNNHEESQAYKKGDEEKTHRGFGFVTFTTQEAQEDALKLGQIKGGRKPTSKKMHTMYLRPYSKTEDEMNLCYLWSQHRCPYGDECKFEHVGEGGCLPSHAIDDAARAKKKKGKCFAFKKGKCAKGDDCPFSHGTTATSSSSSSSADPETTKPAEPTTTTTTKKKLDIPKSEKDCINWKTKGKCRKGDKCPYKHDPQLQKKALQKLAAKKKKSSSSADTQQKEKEKEKQPLSVRVFGLNYDTTEADIRQFFEGCGPIQDVTFPIFEDSGRSKGYCGVWFSSPKAVAKAIAFDGQELHGRWLQIQAGKMYLKQWEANEGQYQQQQQQQQQQLGPPTKRAKMISSSRQ
ncbi:MAG: hypothetical protein SGBAC_011101 [Bacillariaceae sp.]